MSSSPTTHASPFSQVAVSRRLLEGVGDMNPDWMRLNVLGDAIAARLAGANVSAPLAELTPTLCAALEAVRLGADVPHVMALVDRLRALGLVSIDGGALRLAVPIAVFATKLEAIGFIGTQLRAGLHAVAEEPRAGTAFLREILTDYAAAAELWKLDPIEARWPVLKAVARLLPDERAQLAAFVDAVSAGERTRLEDSIGLMLGNPISSDWLAHQAPHLSGRDIFIVTPEGLFNAAGGLGRVTQYHTTAMARLVGSLATVTIIEPMYGFRMAARPHAEIDRLDYHALARESGATPPERVRELMLDIRGRPVPLHVYTSRLPDGRVASLLSDPTEYYARVMYAYGRFGQASWAEFAEWISEGAVAAIACEMHDRRARRGDTYRPPLISAHDAQTALVPEVKLRVDQSGDSILWEAREYFTTHTVLNRPGENLETMGIPEGHRWAGDRMGWLDATSFGIRIADGRNAVSSAHAAEVESIDPGFDIVAISNGTSIRDFEERLRTSGAADLRNPTVEEIERAKTAAKKDLALALGFAAGEAEDISRRMVVSYSGRMVPEKVSRGENGALVDANLTELARLGVVVIVYGNVQPGSAESARLHEDLVRLSGEVAARSYPGRVIVRSGWNQRDQLALLAATDLQVQVSDSILSPALSFADGKPVGTEAAGYTEAPVGRFAGLQMGPVEVHGLLNRVGTLVDWSKPRSGSVLLAKAPTSAAYLEEMVTAAQHFQRDPGLYYSMGQAAYAFGPVYDALLTAAEYLRQFSGTWLQGSDGKA